MGLIRCEDTVPVHIVSQKEVVCVRWVARLVKVPEQIAELAVDVADDVDWRFQLQQHGLTQEHLSRHQAQLADLVLGQRALQANLYLFCTYLFFIQWL